jgi:heme-degrading monooxygenase HmoA
MIAVIFEVYPTKEGKDEYLSFAASLREHLKDRPGFISIERFQSLGDENKILSLSFWESEEAVQAWRNLLEHRVAQKNGKNGLFEKYRIRVAQVSRDYTGSERNQAPSDSNAALA